MQLRAHADANDFTMKQRDAHANVQQNYASSSLRLRSRNQSVVIYNTTTDLRLQHTFVRRFPIAHFQGRRHDRLARMGV